MRTKTLSVALASLVFSCAIAHADTAVKCPFKTLGSCPTIGCAKPNTPLATTNSLKRKTALTGSPGPISFSDMKNLQDDLDKEFANGPITVKGQKVSSPRNMTAVARKILLSGLKSGTLKFNEGDFVEITGFIASKKLPPHPNTGESVNCKLKDEPSNDYHINITPDKNSDETKGVVVEMIPQDVHRKDKSWDLKKLGAIQEKQLPVKIRGRLFLDNEHKPNTGGDAGGNPRRFSIWELHPIKEFFVCPSGSCPKSSDWKALEDWIPDK
jgi:hypothetical protein